jgi:uncharacterized protein DUF6992
MWSDTLLAAERSHLLRVAIWAVTSASLGTTFVAIIMVRQLVAPIALWFAVQTMVWGSLELIVSAARWFVLSMRDVAGATRLERLTWFAIGLDIGIVGAGVTAALIAWRLKRHVGAFGGGLGVVVQGLGLLVLDLTFATMLTRLV